MLIDLKIMYVVEIGTAGYEFDFVEYVQWIVEPWFSLKFC